MGSDDHPPSYIPGKTFLVAPTEAPAHITKIYFSRTIQFRLLWIPHVGSWGSHPFSFGNRGHAKLPHNLDLRVDA